MKMAPNSRGTESDRIWGVSSGGVGGGKREVRSVG